MDEILEIKESQFGVPLSIPDHDELYRQVPLTQLEEGRFPQPGHFTIKYDRGEKELSTNWSAFTDTLDSYCIIGLTANINGAYILKVKWFAKISEKFLGNTIFEVVAPLFWYGI